MTEKSPNLRNNERLAVAQELAVLLGYAQMIEILSGHPSYLAVLGGPFRFVLICSLAFLLLLLPVPSIVRGRWWAHTISWGLAVLCFADGFLFLLRGASGWLSSLGIMLAGLFLVDRLLRGGESSAVAQEQAST